MSGFGDLPEPFGDPGRARVAVIPVPYDGTSTWLKGADRGPAAIIDASAHLELYDIQTAGEPYRLGILTDEPVLEGSSPEAMVRAVEQRVSAHLQAGRFPVVLGGEHSVSIGAMRAAAARHPGLCFLQLDAHTDLRPEYGGSPFSHASVMARARELGPIVQVGIRSLDAAERASLDPRRVFYAERLRRGWAREVVRRLSPKVYLTLDLDVLDPAFMPSTGTPEPGGLDWYQVLSILRLVCRRREVVGFDLVELAPGENRAPDFLAAKLVYKLLAYLQAYQPAFRPVSQPASRPPCRSQGENA
jgi:agmatinase